MRTRNIPNFIHTDHVASVFCVVNLMLAIILTIRHGQKRRRSFYLRIGEVNQMEAVVFA